MVDGESIEIVGRFQREDGGWETGVRVHVLEFAGWGETQHVPASGGPTWTPERYAVSSGGDVVMRGEMVEIGGVLTTGDVLGPGEPLRPDEAWHFIVPRPVE